MRIPVPEYQRQVMPTGGGGRTPQAQAPGMGGVFQAAQSLERAAMDRARVADQQQQNFERAQHEQMKARNVERVSNARLEWTQALVKRQEEADPEATNFTGSALSDFDKWQDKSLSALEDPKERDMLKGMLFDVRERVQSNALNFEVGQRRAYRKRVVVEGIEADAKVTAADPAQFQDVLAMRLAAISSSADLTPDQKAELTSQAREKLSFYAAMTSADRNPDALLETVGAAGAKTGKDGKVIPSDPEKAAQAVKNDPILSNLSPQALRQVIDRATTLKVQREALAEADRVRRERQAEIAANQREREATQAWAILSPALQEGRALDMTSPTNQRLLQALSGTPFAQAYREAIAGLPDRAAAAMLPLSTQRETIAALQARRNERGTTPELDAEIKRREKVLEASERDYKDDPMRAGLGRGIIGSLAEIDPTNPATYAARVSQAETVSARADRPVSLLTPQEADVLRDHLEAMPAKQRSQLTAAISAALGPRLSQGLAEQMAPKDAALSHMLAYSGAATTHGRKVAELFALGAQGKKDGTSTRNATKSDLPPNQWEAVAATYMVGIYPNQAEGDKVREAAVLLAHGIASEQGGELSEDDIKRAARLAMGGEPREYQGRRVLLPAGVTPAQMTDKLKSVSPESIQAQTGDTVLIGAAKMPVAEFVKALPGQQLIYAGPGLYSVVVNERIATNAKGQPIKVRVP